MTAQGRHQLATGRHRGTRQALVSQQRVRGLPLRLGAVIIGAGLMVAGALPLAMTSVGSAAAGGQIAAPSPAVTCPPESDVTDSPTATTTPVSAVVPAARAASPISAAAPAKPCGPPSCPPVIGTDVAHALPCCEFNSCQQTGLPTPSPTVTPTSTPTQPTPPQPTSRVVVAVSAHGSSAAFSFSQRCGSKNVTFALTDGKSHVTQAVPAGTVCTVTESGGPPGQVNVAVTGSRHASSVQNNPPRGIGTVRAKGTLKFTFTAPTGGVKVGQVTPSALPPVVVLPGKPAKALSFAATGNGRSPLIAPSASPTVSPSAPPTEQITLDTEPAALATPPPPGIRSGALAGACAFGLGLIGIAAFGARSATRRGR